MAEDKWKTHREGKTMKKKGMLRFATAVTW
jgi:hypothetical protein